jgi:copper chaperone CopZ
MFRIIAHRLLTEPQASSIGVAQRGTLSRATLRVDGLVCSACAIRVRRHLERMPGVRHVEVSLDRAEAAVDYDPAQIAPPLLVAAVEEAIVARPIRRILARLADRLRPSSDTAASERLCYAEPGTATERDWQ